MGLTAYPRVAVSHHCPVLKIYFTEFKRCEDLTSIKTIRIVDFLKVSDGLSAHQLLKRFTTCSHLRTAAACLGWSWDLRLDMETPAPRSRPLASPPSNERGRMHSPPPKFSYFELICRDAQTLTGRRPAVSLRGGLYRFLARTVCADSARVARGYFAPPHQSQRKCRQRTTGPLKRSARDGGITASACV